MKLFRLIGMFLLSCFVSMYVFPIGFSFFPASLNTKMVIGALGIVAYVWNAIRVKEALFRKTTIFAMLLAIVFSLWCYYSMVANGTPDDAYATYFVSFSVWLGGAYCVCSFIKAFHGKLNMALLVQYLLFVCAAQCALALIIDSSPSFKNFVDTYVQQGQGFLHEVNRLYGIGASLDPAGCRFSVVLIMAAHLMVKNMAVTDSRKQMLLALALFFFVVIVGNMISRTTIVGAGLGLVYIFFGLGSSRRGVLSRRTVRFYSVFLLVLAVAVAISVVEYRTNPNFHANIRFAFEAFFNLFEDGEFRTGSTDKLSKTMWIWPTTVREWTIGTGWFGFFMYSTDIGYCRLVLYCGLVGLVLFSLFFVYDTSVVWRKFRDFKFAALLLLSLTFLIWIKVATDIFWIYALLFCLPSDREESGEELVE